MTFFANIIIIRLTACHLQAMEGPDTKPDENHHLSNVLSIVFYTNSLWEIALHVGE